MTKKTDEDFSLKEWVMKRAANQTISPATSAMPAQAVVEDEDRILGSKAVGQTSVKVASQTPTKNQQPVTPKAPTEAQAKPFEVKSQERASEMSKPQEKSKMTRFSNGVAPSVNNGANNPLSGGGRNASPAQAVQQLQIVRLLQDLGERLRQSEKEREILWRELDGCRKLLTDIEDKTSKTEKAYLTLENRMSQKGETNPDIEKLSQTLQQKLEAIETTTGSAIVRIEDAINENAKLSRRLDQVTQDKARLLRKLDTMEETLTQTQDALKAKALVLLTDQALAARTNLPQSPAWTGNDTLRMSGNQPQAAKAKSENAASGIEPLIDEGSLFRKPARMNTALLVSIATVLGIGGGWAVSKMQVPDFGLSGLFTPSTDQQTAEAPDQDELMQQVASLANQIEPGAAISEDEAVAAKGDALLKDQAEQAALAAFKADGLVGDIEDRISPDTSLPKNVKEIEKRAFGGDGEAQHDLAAIYTAGHAGVKTNYVRASEWFTEAAYNNVSNAQYNLGVLYHQGLGVKQDTRKAIQLYRVAAANNHPEAQYNLGIAHIEGVGADYSPRLAKTYFEKAASQGIVEAAYNLGLIEENGLLGDENLDEALFWYKTAADEGNAQAVQALRQLQKQRKLGDQDVAKIHNRIAVLKPNAFTPKEVGRQINLDPAAAPVEESKASNDAVKAIKATKVPVKTEVQKVKPGYETVIVTQIQEQLARMGMYSGPADGVSNAATEEAVKAYQSMNKLKADGKPTEDVLVHMLAHEMQMGAEPAIGSDNINN